MKTAKTPGNRTREKTSIFLAANLKLVNQADTRFVGILNKNIRNLFPQHIDGYLIPKRSKNKEPSTDRISFEIRVYIGGFEPGLEYQRVLVLDVDRRATHLLQGEAF